MTSEQARDAVPIPIKSWYRKCPDKTSDYKQIRDIIIRNQYDLADQARKDRLEAAAHAREVPKHDAAGSTQAAADHEAKATDLRLRHYSRHDPTQERLLQWYEKSKPSTPAVALDAYAAEVYAALEAAGHILPMSDRSPIFGMAPRIQEIMAEREAAGRPATITQAISMAQMRAPAQAADAAPQDAPGDSAVDSESAAKPATPSKRLVAEAARSFCDALPRITLKQFPTVDDIRAELESYPEIRARREAQSNLRTLRARKRPSKRDSKLDADIRDAEAKLAEIERRIDDSLDIVELESEFHVAQVAHGRQPDRTLVVGLQERSDNQHGPTPYDIAGAGRDAQDHLCIRGTLRDGIEHYLRYDKGRYVPIPDKNWSSLIINTFQPNTIPDTKMARLTQTVKARVGVWR